MGILSHVFWFHSVKRTLTKFKFKAQSATFRRDGKLIAAGSDDVVKVFRATGGSTLRVFAGHRDNVEVVRFSYNKLHVFSGSHDFTCRLWSLASGGEVSAFASTDCLPIGKCARTVNLLCILFR